MRICLVAHGFPPHERSGVENFTANLARGLAAVGHAVDVFVPRAAPVLADLSLRTERRDGYDVHWFTVNRGAADPAEALDPPGHAEHFGRLLDRLQPHVVHFQHVFRVGLGLLEAAAERGLPIVYTGHDYYPVCHRITLLRPDLERCDTIGDADVCARCDLALALLNDKPELGDYHMGAFAGDLDPDERRRLAATLSGDEEGSGFHPDEWEAARARRRALDGRRAALFGLVDRFLCPTRYLAERLVEGGVAREKIVHLPYGIDSEALAAVPRPDAAELASRPLRFGFVGSLTKHKGVHVLLDAFERVEGRATLTLYGDSTDRPYVERMTRLAEAVGAEVSGAFDQRELPAILGALDVLVVPSIWVENYPLAIREAFAAGRPVIATAVGAFSESVRDGVDGLTFPAGDDAALGACLARCVDDPALVARLRAGIEPVHTLRAHVAEHEAIYTELDQARRARRAGAVAAVLPHLVDVASRFEALERLPSVALFERVAHGLDDLAARLGARREGPGGWMARALRQSARTHDRLRDSATESAYLRAEIGRHVEAEHALAAREAWRAELLASAEDRAAWLESQVEGLKTENAWLRETVSGLETAVQALTEERDWRAESEATERARADAAVARLVELEPDIGDMASEIEALRSIVAHREEQLAALRSDHERIEAERAWREGEMDRAVDALAGRLAGLVPARLALHRELTAWRRGFDAERGARGGEGER